MTGCLENVERDIVMVVVKFTRMKHVDILVDLVKDRIDSLRTNSLGNSIDPIFRIEVQSDIDELEEMLLLFADSHWL